MTTLLTIDALRQRLKKMWRRFPVTLYRVGLARAMGALPVLILTTRKTTTVGARHTPLEYRRHGSRIYVISPEPDTARWFAHIRDQTYATLRIGDSSRPVRATIVTDEAEAVRALFLFRLSVPAPLRWVTWSARKQAEIQPQALKKTARRYAVVRLEAVPKTVMADVLPPVTHDRAWVWWWVGVAVVVVGFILGNTRRRG
ncbi:MAG: nitroreductase family deazaflavin-dependent oxidoreductase [Anaerolineae bacterium]|nr:nitroreductase family deazaflavin-dependent oxidoreductase [Anaerolineae bacterium]